MKAKDSTLEIKHFVKEGRDPLLTMTVQVMSKQCWTRWTWISEFQDYHILLWNMRRVQAFENWFRKLRNTQTDHALQQDLQQNQAFYTFSSSVKENDSGGGQHRIVWIARDGSQNAMQSMPIILECRHRLSHVRAFLAGNRSQSRFHCIYHGPFINSRVRHQEGKTSRPQIWEKARRQRILSG